MKHYNPLSKVLPLSLFFTVALLASQPAFAADSVATLLSGSTVLTSASSYSGAALSATTDVFLSSSNSYTSGTTLTIDNGLNLNIGALDDNSPTALLITNTAGATSGTMTLNANNTNSLSGGAASGDLLFVSSSSNLTFAPISGASLTIATVNSGNFDNAGTLIIGGSLSIGNGTTLTFTGAGATTVSANIAATTGLVTVNNSGGSVIFSGSNSYTGATKISPNATLQLQANAGNIVSGTSYALGATALTMGALNGSNSTLQLRSDSSVTFNGGNSLGGLGGNSAGGETITIDVNNLGTSGDTATSGTLAFAPGGFATLKTTINVTGGNGYTLALGAISGNSNALTFNPTTANVIVNGAISSVTALTKNGGGILTLTASNTYTGTTKVNNGTLQLQANAGNTSASGTSYALGSASGNLTLANGSTLQLRSDTSVTFNGTDALGGLNSTTITIDVNNITAGTTNGATNGGASKQILSLASATTFLGSSGQFNITGGDGYTLAFGALQTTNGNNNQTWTFNPTSASVTIASYTNGASTGNTLALAGTSTGNAVLGAIANSGLAVTKSGASTWTLSGTNTYTGLTTVSAGTLQIGNGASGSIINTGTSTVAVGATLAFDMATSGSYGGTIADSGTVAGIETAGITNTLGGVISGTGVFTQSGSGTTILTGTDTYSGATTVSLGALQIGNGTSGSILNTGTSTVAAGATLAFDMATSGSYGGTIADSGTVAGIETAGITNTLGGVISGTGGFTQSGAGTTILTGSDTYNGATTVNAGTLKVTRAGTLGSAQGGTLNGASAITVTGGGTLLVAASNALGSTSNVTLGNATTTGTLALSNASQGASTQSTAGTFHGYTTSSLGNNGLVVSGSTTGGSTATVTAGLGALTLSNNSTIDFGSGSTPETLVFSSYTDNNFNLNVLHYTNSSAIASNFTNSGQDGTDDRLIFGGLGTTGLTTAQLDDISFSTNGTVGAYGAVEISLGNGFYEVTAVPEPTTLFASLLVLGFLGLRERRRLSELYRQVTAKKA